MKTNTANALFKQVAQVLLDPTSNENSRFPPVGRFPIDFEGYKGITDLIGDGKSTFFTCDPNWIAWPEPHHNRFSGKVINP